MIQYFYFEVPASQISTIDIISLISALAAVAAAIIMIVQNRARLSCSIEVVPYDEALKNIKDETSKNNVMRNYDFFDIVIQNVGIRTAENIKLQIETEDFVDSSKIEEINTGRYPKFLCKDKSMRIRIKTDKNKNLPITIKLSYNHMKTKVYKLNTNEADLTKVSDLSRAFGLKF